MVTCHRSFSDPFWYMTDQIQFGRTYFTVNKEVAITHPSTTISFSLLHVHLFTFPVSYELTGLTSKVFKQSHNGLLSSPGCYGFSKAVKGRSRSLVASVFMGLCHTSSVYL